MPPKPDNSADTQRKRVHPFRRAVLRGAAVLLPPLLTLLILIWVWHTILDYVVIPVENLANDAIVYFKKDIHDAEPTSNQAEDGKKYVEVEGGKWIPFDVYDKVEADPGPEGMPPTPEGIYQRWAKITYLQRWKVITVSLSVLILLLYVLGRFIAAGVGRMFWNGFNQLLNRVPVIRNIYSSVKQVTDFVFSEREMSYTRVVAIQYPRKGLWSLGFVTGESMLDIRSVANEPVLSVLMPTSPMPATGFTITVRKSETVDLNITIDQALQFVVSCGVVVAPQQQQGELSDEIAAAIADHVQSDEDGKDAAALPAPAADDSTDSQDA